MRVIGGVAKGTRLYGARGHGVRPVIDRVKESVFDVLGEGVEGANVLDLFAGVGSLGIEALSRGAVHVDFIESHRPTSQAITANLERSHLADRGRVLCARLPRALSRVEGQYGLIFTDPPFRIDRRLMEEIFHRIRAGGLLEESGLVIYRHSPHGGYDPPEDEWTLVDSRDYGDSLVFFYRLGD